MYQDDVVTNRATWPGLEHKFLDGLREMFTSCVQNCLSNHVFLISKQGCEERERRYPLKCSQSLFAPDVANKEGVCSQPL